MHHDIGHHAAQMYASSAGGLASSLSAPAQVAAKLAERGWLPDVIVSSDSTRTKQTLAMMADAHPAFREAATLFRGSLYTVAALDGQTRKHLQVCGHIAACRTSLSLTLATESAPASRLFIGCLPCGQQRAECLALGNSCSQ